MIYDLFARSVGFLFFFFFPNDIMLRSGNHEVDEQSRIGGNVSFLPCTYRRGDRARIFCARTGKEIMEELSVSSWSRKLIMGGEGTPTGKKGHSYSMATLCSRTLWHVRNITSCYSKWMRNQIFTGKALWERKLLTYEAQSLPWQYFEKEFKWMTNFDNEFII